MSYVQDFVNVDWCNLILLGGCMGVLSCAMVMFLLLILKKKDPELCLSMKRGEYVSWLIVCIFSGLYIVCQYRTDQVNIWVGFLMLTYLVLCCVTDYHSQMIYDIVQLGMCILLVPVILRNELFPGIGVELIMFAGIQVGIFRQMYGDADVMGFLICALSLAGGGMMMWTIHMAITFLFLGIAQGWRRNIASDGNLKEAVPLYPYMAVAYIFVF